MTEISGREILAKMQPTRLDELIGELAMLNRRLLRADEAGVNDEVTQAYRARRDGLLRIIAANNS